MWSKIEQQVHILQLLIVSWINHVLAIFVNQLIKRFTFIHLSNSTRQINTGIIYFFSYEQVFTQVTRNLNWQITRSIFSLLKVYDFKGVERKKLIIQTNMIEITDILFSFVFISAHFKCHAHGITCPSITYPGVVYPILAGGGVPHPDLAGGYPPPGTEVGTPCLELGTPPRKGPGTNHWDTPQKGYGTIGSIMGWRWSNPPRKDMGPVKVLLEGDVVTPPPTPGGRQTENITSRRTSYAGRINMCSNWPASFNLCPHVYLMNYQ